jgi:uncharacterized coiled-coil DUF342 family protein
MQLKSRCIFKKREFKKELARLREIELKQKKEIESFSSEQDQLKEKLASFDKVNAELRKTEGRLRTELIQKSAHANELQKKIDGLSQSKNGLSKEFVALSQMLSIDLTQMEPPAG